MDETTVTAPAVADDNSTAVNATDADAELVDEELLVEEISIDGMCGVY
jgi:mycofactocin precursor